jgi:hypothetical protein
MVQAEIKYLLGNNGDRIPYVVADGSAIAKGDFLVLNDNMVVTAAAAAADVPVVGVAAHEKVANDGHTSITAITNAVIKCTVVAGGSATIGDEVSLSATAGEVTTSSSLDDEKGWSIGYALQDAAAGHTVFVRMRK